jgi:hypothetical protein
VPSRSVRIVVSMPFVGRSEIGPVSTVCQPIDSSNDIRGPPPRRLIRSLRPTLFCSVSSVACGDAQVARCVTFLKIIRGSNDALP